LTRLRDHAVLHIGGAVAADVVVLERTLAHARKW
jgi:hypothetical protein